MSTASFQLHGALRVLHINERATPLQAHSEAVNKFTWLAQYRECEKKTHKQTEPELKKDRDRGGRVVDRAGQNAQKPEK